MTASGLKGATTPHQWAVAELPSLAASWAGLRTITEGPSTFAPTCGTHRICLHRLVQLHWKQALQGPQVAPGRERQHAAAAFTAGRLAASCGRLGPAHGKGRKQRRGTLTQRTRQAQPKTVLLTKALAVFQAAGSRPAPSPLHACLPRQPHHCRPTSQGRRLLLCTPRIARPSWQRGLTPPHPRVAARPRAAAWPPAPRTSRSSTQTLPWPWPRWAPLWGWPGSKQPWSGTRPAHSGPPPARGRPHVWAHVQHKRATNHGAEGRSHTLAGAARMWEGAGLVRRLRPAATPRPSGHTGWPSLH